MIQIFAHWALAIILMIAFDFVWISLMVRRLYVANIGHLMARDPNLYAAAVFYLIYAISITVFITYPAVSDVWLFKKVALYGALFGLTAYGTFDLTNQALLKNWSITVTVVDMAWGAILTSVVCCCVVKLSRLFL